MPSPHELHLTTPVGDDAVAPADVLARVKAEGARRRRRRHGRNGVLAAVALAVVAVPAASLLPDGGDDQRLEVAAGADEGEGEGTGGEPAADVTSDRDPTPTSVAEAGDSEPAPGPSSGVPTTSVVPAGEATGDSTRSPRRPTTPSTVQASAAPAPPTTVAAPPPTPPTTAAPPANQPLTASFVSAPAEAVVGEQVRFVVRWADPDATLSYQYFSANGTLLGEPCVVERLDPAAPPPTPRGGSGEITFEHTFTEPGAHEVAVALGTGACQPPYADGTVVSTTITVTEL